MKIRYRYLYLAIFSLFFLLSILFKESWQILALSCVSVYIILFVFFKTLDFKKMAKEFERVSESYNSLKNKGDLILNSIIEGVCWLDKYGKIIFANRSAKYILGYMEDSEIIGKDFHELVHRDERGKEGCAVSLTIRSGTCNIFRNEKFYRKDGKRVPVSVFTSPIVEEGKITGAVVTFIDLTHEKKQQEEIRKYKTIIDQASVIILITDSEGVIEYVNPAFELTTGYLASEVIGKKPSILKSGKHSEEFYKSLWKTIKDGKIWEGEFINRKKSGELYYEEATIFPIRNSEGEIINFVAIKKDITKTKELKEMLAQAQKLEAIGRLTGGIAHDFNNILTVISGYAEILQTTIDRKSKEFNHILKIAEAVSRAKELVSKLLAFSRKQDFNPKPIDAVQEIKKLEKMLKRLIPEDIFLKFEYREHSLIIYSDPTQLEQILFNLVVNARDALEEREDVEVKEILISVGKSDGFAEIRVKDNGIGIPKEIQKKIFEPFFTTKEPGIGTGLGLSTVYGIVMQNRGKIKVNSEPLKGAEFVISLPLYEKEEIESAEFEKESPSFHRGSGKVLVVEDEVEIREILKDVLSCSGYTVFEAKNGMEALFKLKENAYKMDLVVCDFIMPEMNGIELYNEVRKINPEIKFLFITGYSEEMLKDKGSLLSNLPVLKKPFKLSELSEKVKEILS